MVIEVSPYLCFGPLKNGLVPLDQHIDLILMMLLWEKGPHQDWPYCLIVSLFHWINNNIWREKASLGTITQQCDKYVIIPDESHEAGRNSKWTLLKSTQFGYPYHVDMKYVYYAPNMWKIGCSLWGYLSGTTTPGVNGMKPEFPFKLQHACSHVRSVWGLQVNDGSLLLLYAAYTDLYERLWSTFHVNLNDVEPLSKIDWPKR